MEVMKINGVHIAYRHRRGLGRTIVFVNSLGSDQSLWDEVVAALPTGYGVLSYDLRGHGHSTGVATSIEELADDLGQLVDALDLEDILLCGISIGGMIGQVLSAKRIDVVHGAIFCNTALKIGTVERWTARIASVEKDGTAGIAENVVSNWFGPDYAAQTDRMALHQAMIARTTDAGYTAACAAIRDAELSEFAAAIRVPVLCIGGTHDQSVPLDAVQALAQTIPRAQMEIIDGLGHLPCLEMPGHLAAIIENFDSASEPLADAGMKIRRAVLGDAHVKRSQAGVTPLDQAFQTLITQGAWGSVWASPGISARERSMLTLALLAATGNFEEIPMHVRASARTGASTRDIAEAFQHVAVYAGVPRANHALKLAKQTLSTMQDSDDV